LELKKEWARIKKADLLAYALSICLTHWPPLLTSQRTSSETKLLNIKGTGFRDRIQISSLTICIAIRQKEGVKHLLYDLKQTTAPSHELQILQLIAGFFTVYKILPSVPEVV